MFKLVLGKAEEPENKLPTSAGSSKKQEFQKNIYFCFVDYAKGFDCMDHNKLWKILKEMGIPDHLTCFLRNKYAGKKAIVRTGHRTTDWFQKEKEYVQGYILSPCFFNLYVENIMRNAGLDEWQTRIKIAGSLTGYSPWVAKSRTQLSNWTELNRPASWETYMQVRKQQLELNKEQPTGSK